MQIVTEFNEKMRSLECSETNTKENLNAVYGEFIDRIMPLIMNKDILVEDVVKICKSEYLLFVELWNVFEPIDKLKQFLKSFYQFLISMGNISLDSEDIEPFCHTGEIMSGVMEDSEAWLYFQKLRVVFLVANRCDEKAEQALNELADIIPDDEFVAEQRYKLQKVEYQGDGKLDEISDFSEYLDYLFRNKERYVIFIASRDTPWGPGFTQQLTYKFMRTLGVKTDLYQKFRCPYVAVIDGGRCVFEELKAQGEYAKWSGRVGNLTVNLIGSSLGKYLELGPRVEINACNHGVKRRGLNFVVFDKEKKFVVDRVAFDTYAQIPVCQRPDALPVALKKWRDAHPEVTLLCYKQPAFPSQNLSMTEKFLMDNAIILNHYFYEQNLPHLPLKNFFNSIEEIKEAVTTPKSYHDAFGVRRFENYSGKVINIVSGHRVTSDQPKQHNRTIYMVGSCNVFGVGTSDDRTSSSCLQRLCNERFGAGQFLVQNYGFFLNIDDSEYLEEIKILEDLPVKPGDIVICDWGFCDDIPIIDLTNESTRPHSYGEIFYDTLTHMTANGYRLVADKIFDYLEAHDIFAYDGQGSEAVKTMKSVQEGSIAELKDYENMLLDLYNEKLSVGAIVMNCNPFTYGHRYLIEQAAKQCAHLIIFVVEEDKSVFKFSDRLNLVKKGVADLENVIVIPSGQFVLSSKTFSEYFNKSELQDRVVDSSTDVNIFAKEIAPCLHITKRFVGTEPFDMVTRQYNDSMKEILPKYGIEVVEIPRLEKGQNVISASHVRQLIADNNLREIQELVPKPTFEFINEHFEELKELIK